MYWHRLEGSLGRFSLVGTTVQAADRLPRHLAADEKHTTLADPKARKVYLAATAGGGCCLGLALAETADADELTRAYGAFRDEARDLDPEYRPETVNTDGWAATRQAWQALFPLAVILRCFLHGWLNIRSRGKLSESFRELSKRVWESYRAPSRRAFAQRLRRLREWARGRSSMSAWLREQVEKLCGRSREYALAYSHPGGHRTSNMLDRVMRAMNRYFDDGQHLHGGAGVCDRHCRAWALLYNFRPWHPATARANGGGRSPAERANRHRYHDNWLHNLLVSASLAGFRR